MDDDTDVLDLKHDHQYRRHAPAGTWQRSPTARTKPPYYYRTMDSDGSYALSQADLMRHVYQQSGQVEIGPLYHGAGHTVRATSWAEL